jgi:predicted GIY-YIG superfamily endonuclease
LKAVSKKENFFVYRFLDANQETLYVGKTKNLTGRIRSTHFTNSGHLPDDCYNETAIVVYSQCLSESDMTIQERYLINTLNPKYNDRLNRSDTFSFTINCFDWQYLPFIRPEERLKKRNIKSGPLTSCLPNVSVQTRPLAVPSLAETGTLFATRDNPGDLYNLYSFGMEFEPLRGLWMNDELWLSALSICEFSFVSCASENSSKIRVIQFIKKGFLTCDDVCIIEDKAFCRSDYRSSVFGKLMKKHPLEAGWRESSNGILIRAQALGGFVDGHLERRTRDEKKRLDKGVSVKAFYRSPSGEFPTKRCKTFEEYCDFMAGPNRTNANLFSVAYQIPTVCDALSCIEPT